MQAATGMNRQIQLAPGGLRMNVTIILGSLRGRKADVHPARIKKLMASTNSCGKKLAVDISSITDLKILLGIGIRTAEISI